MNDKIKIVGASILVLGGVGIWVPQLPEMFGGSKNSSPARTQLPAEGSPSGVLPGMPPLDGGSAPEVAPEVTSVESSADDPLARIEALLLDDSEEGGDLTKMAMSWRGQQAEQEQDADPNAPQLEEREPLDPDPPMPLYQPNPFDRSFGGGKTFAEGVGDEEEDPFDLFIRDHPLSGLLVGEKRQVASFGAYTLQAGDWLPGTDARLVRIERRAVIVSRGGKEFAVSLPPFRSQQEPDENALPGAMPEADDVAVPTPDDPVADAPPTPDSTGDA